MKIKNYTSTVPAERTIADIEHLLVKAGASHIAKSYEGGKVNAFTFQLFIGPDNPMTFKLPSRVDKVYARMIKEISFRRVRDRKAKEKQVLEQAERTAWKLLLEMIEVNVSLIMIDQVNPLEVFMAYLYNFENNHTLFDIILKNPENAQKLLK